jgi:hypothetical protein
MPPLVFLEPFMTPRGKQSGSSTLKLVNGGVPQWSYPPLHYWMVTHFHFTVRYEIGKMIAPLNPSMRQQQIRGSDCFKRMITLMAIS